MLVYWHCQISFQLEVKILNDILTDSPQIINDKVLFAVHIYLIRSIDILTSLIISQVFLMILIFTPPTTIPIWPGVKISYDISTPPPPSSNNQWQSFICLSCLLEKMYYHVKIILVISWVFIMLLFCITNTRFHKVINGFISCKLKQDTSHLFILFW